ncbi:SDR family NAD(P)-dependent oxidoreductase [Nesterenkonia sp. YGD6]|uniref:SDR family NAD(P)-dependent oxidoreductase n=1 Tax=Nesterenkonia sp. YGD6 TaxID=2901231 RepID=UPI001F4D0526|nr:SDR family NAD(P)-dependent oxidoreductase [Nesterenkonia sp. YGD6]MCH8563707.1 SDR family NAD(P)-dependent oxidoreductase [Nesterenkonia sp. YGD6]
MTHNGATPEPVSRFRPSVVLVTGPTSGIGSAVFSRLLEHSSSPCLVLLARDQDALEHCVAIARGRGLVAHGIRVDLSDLSTVQAASAAVSRLVERGEIGNLDAVVLNAGVMLADRRRLSAQGYELTFAVNVLAQHALLRGLQGPLSPRGHVIVLGSSTHRGKRATLGLVPNPVWQPPAVLSQPERGPLPSRRDSREQGGVAYASSRLALITLAHEWADRFASLGRRLNVYDPGFVVGTGLVRDRRPHEDWVWRRVMPVMSVIPGVTTPSRTARHLVALALGETSPDLHDGYVEMGRVSDAEPVTFDSARRQALWDWCEQTVDEAGTRRAS